MHLITPITYVVFKAEHMYFEAFTVPPWTPTNRMVKEVQYYTKENKNIRGNRTPVYPCASGPELFNVLKKHCRIYDML